MSFSEFKQRIETEKEVIQIDYSNVNKVLSFAVIGDVHAGAWHNGELYFNQALTDKGYDPEELKLVFSQVPFDSLSLTDSHYLREFVCAGFVDGFFGANNHRTEFFRRNCPLPLEESEMEGLFYMFPTFKVGSLFKPQSEFPGFLIIHYFDNRYFEIERVLLGELDENF
jgi:hypothetical protein